MPMLTKTPVPTIEPRPKRIALGTPSSRCSLVTRAILPPTAGAYENLRSRSELVTTDTLEKAMAAAAIIGLSTPAAANGIAATL